MVARLCSAHKRSLTSQCCTACRGDPVWSPVYVPHAKGRSRLFAPKTTASSRFKLHSALRLRKQHVVSYPHIGIKSHVHAAAFYDFKPLSQNKSSCMQKLFKMSPQQCITFFIKIQVLILNMQDFCSICTKNILALA